MKCRSLLLVLILGLSSCTNTRNKSLVAQESSEMFVEIDWLGAQTKPMYTVAFATSGKEKQLRKWLGGDAEYKRMAVISSAEATKLRELLGTSTFTAIRKKAPPNGIFQGYVIACDS